MKYCKQCGKQLSGDSMFCTKCGTSVEENTEKSQTISNDQPEGTFKGGNNIDDKMRKIKKSHIIIISIVVLILAASGVFFIINKDVNNNILASTLKQEKKLNTEINGIDLTNYPIIEVTVKYDEDDSCFSKENIKLYEDDKEISEYEIKKEDSNCILSYTTTEKNSVAIQKEVKIQNKNDENDIISKVFDKPIQNSAKLKITQIDSNNFPQVDMYFTVENSQGEIIENLTKNNFNLIESESFTPEIKDLKFVRNEEAVSINMVMDVSGSMSNDINTCKRIALNFIENIDFNIGDTVETIEFNDVCKINNYFTANKQSLINSINGMETDGQTALYDSLIMALKETNKNDGAKCIIAFTDGLDNRSKSKYNDVIQLSKNLGIPIYIIGLGKEVDTTVLKEICDKTEGEFISIDNIDKLNDSYNRILRKTKSQYVLTYDSNEVDDSSNLINMNLMLNSLSYIKEYDFNYNIKQAEYRVNIAKYNELKDKMKVESDTIFKDIKGEYSLAFRDLNQASSLSINSEKTVAASTIKMFIMIEAFEQIKSGNLRESDTIVLQDSMKAGGSGILAKEEVGKRLTISELISLMMIKSDNTAANILIDKLGMSKINNTIKALGCINTELNRKMMDESAIKNGIENYTSVDDMCLLLSKIYNNQCIDSIYDNKMLSIMKQNETKSKIPNELPEGVEVANKSGEYEGVQNDAGIIFTDKGAYILCVTTRDGEVDSQVSSISSISKIMYDYYIKYKQ